jgi:predicted ATPase with chaperone activity
MAAPGSKGGSHLVLSRSHVSSAEDEQSEGQESAKRALELAAAGGHHMLMVYG